MTRLLEWFNRWFSSRGGVYQTLALTALVVVFEGIYPDADPNHFWVLYVLTVYSGVTQNILAYGNNKTAQRTELILRRLQRIEHRTYDAVTEIAHRKTEGNPPQ
jgi:hypothetical protein